MVSVLNVVAKFQFMELECKMTSFVALTKLRGYLVLAEYTKSSKNDGKCPICGSNSASLRNGWVCCDECDFAILKSDYDRICQS